MAALKIKTYMNLVATCFTVYENTVKLNCKSAHTCREIQPSSEAKESEVPDFNLWGTLCTLN